MAIAKVIYKESSSATGEVWMDVTQKTVTSATMLSDITALKNDGTGVVGNIAFKSATNLRFSSSTATFVVPSGYYSGAINWTITSKGAETFTPAETVQTIASYQWLTGSQTIAAISSTYVGTGVSRRTAANLTANGSTITAAAGYYSSAVSKSISGGTATTPATTITANPTITVNANGLITATTSTSQNITPTIVSGYISTGTAGKISVSGTNTSQLTSVAAATIYPSTVAQTISSGRYLTGTQTFAPVTTVNLEASYIASGVTVKVGDAANASRISQVTGTFAGGGGGFYEAWAVNDTTNNPIDASNSEHLTGIAALSRIHNRAFYGRGFTYGTYNFNEVSAIDLEGFCVAAGPYNASPKSITLNFPKCTYVGVSAFRGFYALYSVTLPLAQSLNSSTFYNCSSMQYIELGSCSEIGSNCFVNCTALSSVSIPECVRIYTYGFASNYSLSSVYSPKLKRIDDNGFSQCHTLQYITLSNCESLGRYAFADCSQLAGPIVASRLSYVSQCAFISCITLSEIDFPSCTYFSSGVFSQCRGLTKAYLSALTTLPAYTFYSCSQLNDVSLPVCSIISSSAFQGCSGLESITLPACTYIYASAFYSCYKLSAVYLTGSSMAALATRSALWSTPIQDSSYLGYFGSIYVPSSLLASYQTATNWVSYSSRIVGI